MEKEILEKILFSFVMFFSILGITFVSISVHEYIHVYDFSGLDKSDEQLCLFAVPTNYSFKELRNSALGYYVFEINEKDDGQYKKIRKYAEIKAYAISTILFFVLSSVLLMFVWINRDFLNERIFYRWKIERKSLNSLIN